MIKRVERFRLPDGSYYTGDYDDVWDRPVGPGLCAYPDGHEAMGTFIGIPNGVAYINYGSRMEMGFFTQGLLHGWGIKMGDGDYCFGVFNRGRLIKDCTFLIEETHDHITMMSRSLRAKGISVGWGHNFPANNEVFFGVMVKGYKKLGIRFFPSGDVYIGMSPYSLDITGTFVHIKDSSIESGIFEKSQLVKSSPEALVHSDSWIELLHTDEVTFDSRDEDVFQISRITLDTIARYL